MGRLEDIHSPEDVQKLNKNELTDLCAQLRDKIVETVSENGGHLSSNLGAVELTVAIHRVFTTPQDAVVWDVGHQCYAHKLLTGRYETFGTLRTMDGISGFPNPRESCHDAFVAGHSSTSISAANGLAKAKALTGEDGYVLAVIGDGALTGGLAYEGLSNAGRSEDNLIVVLNDNKMSISQNVGFVARYLNHLRSRVRYVRWKQRLAMGVSKIPLIGRPVLAFFQDCKKRIKQSLLTGNSFFENMGFHYLGPVDGHNLSDLTQALLAAKSIGGPVVVHVATVKGKGYSFAEKDPDTYHGVSGFDRATGETKPSAPTFSSCFGQALCRLAAEDDRIVAVTAAMKNGTCLKEFARQYPTRFFDAGIAEEHAVTFSSGMAAGGLLPVFAVYSSFLQRSYDQLLNDTSLMHNHIVLAVDRAGVVPDDGETHQGNYDIAMLRSIPGVSIYAPSNDKELELHLRQALYDTDGIAAVRYPKGGERPLSAAYEPVYAPYDHLPDKKKDVLLVTYGRTLEEALTVRRQRQQNGEHLSILKLNRIWPLDPEAVAVAAGYETVLVAEESARQGGIGDALATALLTSGFTGRYAVQAIDETLGACTTPQGLHRLGLDSAGLASFIREAARKPVPAEE